MEGSGFIEAYFNEMEEIIRLISRDDIVRLINNLKEIRDDGGRIFFLGVGGGAGNAAHAVNDFRKIAGFQAYAPTDNVSELTARINDDGWDTAFLNWLKGNKINAKDGVFIFSVGGGSIEKNVSAILVHALKYAKEVKAKILGIVGKDGGCVKKLADSCVIIPTVNKETITPHTESFQAAVWHLIVSHPEIKQAKTKWESIK